MPPAIQVSGLWKRYRYGTLGYGTLRHDLQSWWARVRGRDDPNAKLHPRRVPGNEAGSDHFWALADVSFTVEPGEVVGIVGRNGAGKSTLLKVLSRVTAPTRGEIRLRGRLASLLEVGTGFHPDLTGRENIFLNGAILGMTRAEVRRQFDAIVAFAGLERFVDTPVKRYSSGMYVRLAFAVAAHLEAEILVVDEVLAVGDVAFQQKALGRMQTVVGEGRTVLFVSHSMGTISRLCERAIWLDRGELRADGPAREVVQSYLAHTREAPGGWRAGEGAGTDCEWLLGARVLSAAGSAGVVDFDQGVVLEMSFRAPAPDESYALAYRVLDASGVDVLSTWDVDTVPERGTEPGALCVARCRIPPRLLRPGVYTVLPLLEIFHHGTRQKLESGSFSLEVSEIGFERFRNRWGVVAPFFQWEVARAREEMP